MFRSPSLVALCSAVLASFLAAPVQNRRFSPAVGRFAHAAATMGLVIALGISVGPGANAAAPTRLGDIFSARTSGWQSPAEGGNGDFVFIDAPAAGASAEGVVTISGRAGNSATDPDGGGGGGGNDFVQQPQVVIAMIDTGGNPYHVDFRDETRLVHPSTYLTGFPANAAAAPLCFIDSNDGAYTYNNDCSTSWQANVTADNAVVGTIEEGDLVWYPGTRLLGKSFAHTDPNSPVGFDQGGGSATAHGSWVSSTAIGNKFGNCPKCMLIILEGDTVEAIDAAYAWAAQQPWIDVITSSVTVGIIGAGVNPGIFPGKHDGAVTASANGKLFLTASGNGAANFGLVPTSTYLYDGSSPAVIPVGASFEDGLASHWSDFPAEIMANGNSRQVADTASMSAETAVGGTSFSSPGAAGVLAHSLLEARRACGDFEEGVSPTTSGALTLLRNNGCAVASGPFADGILTRDELHEAFVKNAIPPYDQLSPIPGPVTWVKNAYGYVDLGHGIGNGGSTIQPLVTGSILGTRAIPVRTLEQYWYDSVVREGQSMMWGPRPAADGDGDAFPRDDAACMPDCAPEELQRYADGFAGLSSASTYQELFDILGVSAEEFAQAAPTGFGGTYEPTPNVAGAIGEVGGITISNDASALTVRLKLSGLLDGTTPTVRSNPVSYEVTFSANHNDVAQTYRLSYEFEAVDLLGLLDGTISEPLTDKFGVFIDSAPDEQGLSSICPITTDLSASRFDIDTNEAVWVIPLTAFSQDSVPVVVDCTFTSGGRALAGGDTLTGISASAVLTIGVVNFGNGLGLFGSSEEDDYTLSGPSAVDSDNDGVADGSDRCEGTPAGADVDAGGCHVAVTVNGQLAGTAVFAAGGWSLEVDFSGHAPVEGAYVVAAAYSTASDTVTLSAGTTGNTDSDGDGIADGADNCPTVHNPDQADNDDDGIGNVCDATPDGEGVVTATLSASPSSADVTDGPVTVTFTTTASSSDPLAGALRYTYYYGDGSNSGITSSATSTHPYGMAGSYQASVVVVDENNNSTIAHTTVVTTTRVTVEPGPVDVVARLSVSTDGTRVPVTATFDASGSTAPAGAIYRFDFGDGSSRTGSSTLVRHVYALPGSYTVTLTVTDPNDAENSGSAIAVVQATDGQRTTAQLAVSPSTATIGQSVSFDASASIAGEGAAIVSYVFDFGDGSGETRTVAEFNEAAALTTHAYAAAGSYTPSVTVIDDASVESKVSLQVRVDRPAPPVQLDGGGGGAFGWLTLLPLLGIAALRRRQTVSRA